MVSMNRNNAPSSRRLMSATRFWLVVLMFAAANATFLIGDVGAQESKPDEQVTAWEYDPYDVLVWISHNNSWRAKALENSLIDFIQNQSKLTDASAWKVRAMRAPNPWNWRFLDNFDQEIHSEELQNSIINSDETRNADKLIVIKLEDRQGIFHSVVQEMDLKTKFWGPAVKRTADIGSLSTVLFDSIKTAFMPITRIDKVLDLKDENEKSFTQVRVQVRAVSIARVAEKDEFGEWSVKQNTGSPVWVDDNEIMLPVIIRKDRRGNVEKIEPIDWTFLSIEEREGTTLNCKPFSMRRAPLAARTGGRTERLALCVRAPSGASTLTLLSNDQERIPLPDLEIYSRRPGQTKDDESEFLGKTDWRGQIKVEPNDDQIRILYVKSGRRPLARVPVVPGLYEQQMTTMPNDEKRLYAEGITNGLFNELLDTVATRQLIGEQIKIALERDRIDRAEGLLKQLRDVPNAREFAVALDKEKKLLLAGSLDKRQLGYIDGYFKQLSDAAKNFLTDTQEIDLTRQIQERRKF